MKESSHNENSSNCHYVFSVVNYCPFVRSSVKKVWESKVTLFAFYFLSLYSTISTLSLSGVRRTDECLL